MYEDNNKLDQLNGCDVLLPPEEGPDAGSHGCQQVIQVHDHVHEAVDEAEEGILTTCGDEGHN